VIALLYREFLRSDRAATSISVKTVLSEEGQEQMQEEMEQSSEVVQSILDTSNEAQSLDSTQDVVKALARINAQQSVIAAMLPSDNIITVDTPRPKRTRILWKEITRWSLLVTTTSRTVYSNSSVVRQAMPIASTLSS
jgi:hypothetical protein